MGFDKSKLALGQATFAQALCSRLEVLGELIVSCNDDSLAYLNRRCIKDCVMPCGPLGGLYSSLLSCSKEYAFVLACDMPNFKIEVAQALCNSISDGVEAVVPRSSDGRVHPLCSIYKASLASLMAEQIGKGDYRMMNLLALSRTVYVDFKDPDLFLNINSPSDYSAYSRSL
jgi:molybdopterin-guanine dinucleotide biosynthesis protein A